MMIEDLAPAEAMCAVLEVAAACPRCWSKVAEQYASERSLKQLRSEDDGSRWLRAG